MIIKSQNLSSSFVHFGQEKNEQMNLYQAPRQYEEKTSIFR